MVNSSDNETLDMIKPTIDRVGTLPLNLCETEDVLKPQFEFIERHEKSSKRNAQPPNSDDASDSHSEDDVDAALETALSMIRPTRIRGIRILASRMSDFLQAGM